MTIAALSLLACTVAGSPAGVVPALGPAVDDTGAARQPNILVVIADDYGVDASPCFDAFDVERAPQPNLQQLCRQGLVFDRAWANPYCSATRADLLTGRHPHRHGVGEPVGEGQPGLPATELLLPAAMDAQGTGYAHAAFGKWHLADDDNGGDEHPNLAGFDHYAGFVSGRHTDYYTWEKVTDGVAETVEAYSTTETVDDAIDWLDGVEQPWLMWLAFHAPHAPLHAPPPALHSYGELADPGGEFPDDWLPYYLAMIESMDTELGRLLDHIGREELENTWIVFMGDNGTWGPVTQGAYMPSRAKGSLYQGGVHVPLVIAGPGLPARGRRISAPVAAVDVFATVLELAGGDPAALAAEGVELDGVSMVPYLEDPEQPALRRFVTAEVYGPKTDTGPAGQAVHDGRYKYIRTLDGDELLFDLDHDPMERRDLSAATGAGPRRAMARLSTLVDGMPVEQWWDEEGG